MAAVTRAPHTHLCAVHSHAMSAPTHTLYHNPWSVCSIMVRQTIAIRGLPQNAASELSIKEEVVDIFHGEQLTERYLCEINPEGQVMILPADEAHLV